MGGGWKNGDGAALRGWAQYLKPASDRARARRVNPPLVMRPVRGVIR